MERIKLTKTALNKFITWSSTRYNDWLGYGTKKYNVDHVFNSLTTGTCEDFEIQCASPAGENPQRGSRKSWRTKQSGGKYHISIADRSVTNIYTKEVLYFN